MTDKPQLPPLGTTATENRSYLAKVAEQLALGQIDRNTADVLCKIARAALAATKHIDEGTKLARYEDLVRQAKKLAEETALASTAEKQHLKKGPKTSKA